MSFCEWFMSFYVEYLSLGNRSLLSLLHCHLQKLNITLLLKQKGIYYLSRISLNKFKLTIIFGNNDSINLENNLKRNGCKSQTH